MIEDITSAITGIFTALTSLISPGSAGATTANAAAYVARLASAVIIWLIHSPPYNRFYKIGMPFNIFYQIAPIIYI